jgi:hypothetical protein
MSLTIAPEVAYVSTASTHELVGSESNCGNASSLQDFDILRTRIDELQYGKNRYPLWRPIVGRLLPEPFSERYRFQIDGLTSVAGDGETPRDAIEVFRERFHIRIQDLLAKRPFEMKPDEKIAWSEIRQLVNVELYRHELPILMRQFGEVLSVRPSKWSVRWEGTGREFVDLQDFPGDFASYHVGQPFEAFVERDQQTMRINHVYQVKRTKNLTHRDEADDDAFANSLQSNKNMPVVPLD